MRRVLPVILSSLGLVTYGAISIVSPQNIPTTTVTPEIQSVEEWDHTESKTKVVEPVIRTEDVVVTEKIPYTTTTKDDNTIAKGTTKVLVDGVDGERTKTYKVTYEDDKEISRELVSSVVTRGPVNKVVANGTYVAPKPAPVCENGTYINVDGNEVCRPSSNPSGATAVCRDGTYSYSQHRSGTCSHHGGVRTWLWP